MGERRCDRRGLLRLLILATLTLVCAARLGGDMHAAQGSRKEYQLKAAFLYNFTSFVTWPKERFASESAPLVIGVFGEDPFGETLELTFRDRKQGSHGFEIRRSHKLEELQDCHLLFTAAGHRKDAAALAAHCRSRSILLVSEDPGFLEEGGIVNFVIVENTVRFEIQVDEAKRSNLKISSRLLRLARIVRDREREGGGR